MKKRRRITTKYGLTQAIIAKYFGYSCEKSFNNSSARESMLKGIERIVEHIENQIVSKIQG